MKYNLYRPQGWTVPLQPFFSGDPQLHVRPLSVYSLLLPKACSTGASINTTLSCSLRSLVSIFMYLDLNQSPSAGTIPKGIGSLGTQVIHSHTFTTLYSLTLPFGWSLPVCRHVCSSYTKKNYHLLHHACPAGVVTSPLSVGSTNAKEFHLKTSDGVVKYANK